MPFLAASLSCSCSSGVLPVRSSSMCFLFASLSFSCSSAVFLDLSLAFLSAPDFILLGFFSDTSGNLCFSPSRNLFTRFSSFFSSSVRVAVGMSIRANFLQTCSSNTSLADRFPELTVSILSAFGRGCVDTCSAFLCSTSSTLFTSSGILSPSFSSSTLFSSSGILSPSFSSSPLFSSSCICLFSSGICSSLGLLSSRWYTSM